MEPTDLVDLSHYFKDICIKPSLWIISFNLLPKHPNWTLEIRTTDRTMSSSSSLRFLEFLGRPLLLASLCSLTILLLPEQVRSACKNPPVIFNFGDSNSDTGGLVAGLGIPVVLPNGRTFFGKSTGRLSDGRLVIDFLCKSPCSMRLVGPRFS